MSIPSSINEQLPYISLSIWLLLFGIMAFRIIHIFSNALIFAILSVQYPQKNLKNPFQTSLERYAKHTMFGNALLFLATLGKSTINLAFTCLRICLFVTYYFLPIFVFMLVMVIVNERWNEFLLFVVNVLNETIGPTLKQFIIFPLQILDVFISNFLPVYNLAVYIIIHAPLQILYYTFEGFGKNHFNLFLLNIGMFFSEFGKSLKSFGEKNTIDCNQQFNTESGLFVKKLSNELIVCYNNSHQNLCDVLKSREIADTCLNHKNREIDLNTYAFQSLRDGFGHGIMIIGSSCETLALVSNFTLFPLIDSYSWKAMDKFINSILNALVVTPIITIERCKMAGGILKRPSMCTPDFSPAFEYLIEFAQFIGQAITNWFDMIYILIFDSKNGEIMQSCSKDSVYETIFKDSVKEDIMGKNVTMLVRMDSNTFALTDGTSTLYIENKGSVKKSISVNNWPISVNPRYGIARTILPTGSNVNDNGIGLLGCACIQ